MTFKLAAALAVSISATASAQAPVFVLPSGSATSAGDVDNDGLQDFLISKQPLGGGAWATDGVSVYRSSDGAELFNYNPGPPVEQVGRTIGAVGDVNGDGNGDIACTQLSGGVVSLAVISGATGTPLYAAPCPAGVGELRGDILALEDLDGDGVRDIAAGDVASLQGAPTAAGWVHFFSGASGAVLRSIPAFDGEAGFGAALELVHDLDGDGRRDLAIGAPRASGDPSEGAVHIVSTASGAQLWSVTGWDSGFGASIAVLGDVDGDGVGEIAIADPGEFISVRQVGSLQVYSIVSGERLQRWEASDSQMGLGANVLAVGDLDGDQIDDLIAKAGARVAPNFHVDSLPIHFFSAATGEDHALTFDDAGGAIAIVGDLNADGRAEYIQSGVILPAASGFASVVYNFGAQEPWPPCFAVNFNSLGCAPWLYGQGSSSVSIGDELKLVATRLRNRQSSLLMAAATPTYPVRSVFARQVVCMSAPPIVFGGQNSGGSALGSDCTGAVSFPIPRSTMAAMNWTAGTAVTFQVWSRDPGYLAHAEISLTNSLLVQFWP